MTKNVAIVFGLVVIFFAATILLVETQYKGPKEQSEVMLRKGKLLLEQDTKEAVKDAMDIFMDVTSRYPGTPEELEARFYLAECYERINLKEAALKKYSELAGNELLAEDMKKNIQFRIAKLRIIKSYKEEGVNSLLTLLGNTTDPILRSEIYTEMGRLSLSEKKYSRAQRQFEIALSEHPNNKTARLNLARVLSIQNKDSMAYGEYERYISYYGKLDNEKEAVLGTYKNEAYAKGKALYKNKKYKEAKPFFDLVLQKFSASKEADLSAYYSGVISLIEKDYKRAVYYFNLGVSNTPTSMDEACYMKKGEAYYKMGKILRAARVFQYLIDHYPKSKYVKTAKEWAIECENAIKENSLYGSDGDSSGTIEGFSDASSKPGPEKNDAFDNSDKAEITDGSDNSSARKIDENDSEMESFDNASSGDLLEIDEREKFSPSGSTEIYP